MYRTHKRQAPSDTVFCGYEPRREDKGPKMQITPQMKFNGMVRIIGIVWILLSVSGCKTNEQRYMESFLAMDEDILEVLVTHAPDADKAVQGLKELGAVVQKDRDKLKAKLRTTLDELSESERQAFLDEAQKRHAEMGTRFEAAVKRYPKERQPEIRRTIAPITR